MPDGTLIRKLSQLYSDPVLRRWIVDRFVFRRGATPAFLAHRPPYLDGLLPLVLEEPRGDFPEHPLSAPGQAISLDILGETVTLAPGEEESLFDLEFDDTEKILAVHRFAWLPLRNGPGIVPWAFALWRAWLRRFSVPDDSWAWHPYTAAERAVNLIGFAAKFGFPAPASESLAALAAHGPAIADRLEYFGDHDTSNHLSDNGRGLFLLGLELKMGKCADMGARILLSEAERIFSPRSGVLREGSTHYHFLLCRNYVQAWLAADRHEHPAAAPLGQIAARALAVARRLVLPGGLPLIGDVSPDCPVDYLLGLAGRDDETGWTGQLETAERADLAALADAASCLTVDQLMADGWVRLETGPWSALCHFPPSGWSPMPGHGHQDMGGFELHCADEPVFIDLGRGSYRLTPSDQVYCSGAMHNTILVDGRDPYPPNKPYYDDGFRRRVINGCPSLKRTEKGVCLTHDGFSRLTGVGAVRREWRMDTRSVSIRDSVAGSGRHRISRILCTTLPARRAPEGIRLAGRVGAWLLTADGEIRMEKTKIWRGYGKAEPATRLIIEGDSRLPFAGEMRIECIAG